MTVTAAPPQTATPVPVSQDLATPRAALSDPALAGWDAEIRAAIERLTDEQEES